MGSSIRGRGGVRATDELERGFVGADRMRGAIRVVFVDEITAVHAESSGTGAR